MATPSDADRLRILLTVHHELATGSGAAGSSLELARALEDRGHAVEVIGFDLLARRRGATPDAIAFPHAVARLLRDRLGRAEVDVVDASSGDLAYVGHGLVRTSACALFTRSHGLEHLCAARRRQGAKLGELALRRRYSLYHGGWRLGEVARSFRTADAALLVNDAEARYATTNLGIAPDRIERTAPIVRPVPSPSTDPLHRDVLVLGPASWRKGGDVAIRVLESLLRGDERLTASWHGLDDPGTTARSFAGDVVGRIQLEGRYDAAALGALLASHRALLFASRCEGLPVTVLEAQSAGVCVVGSDVPGVHDLLQGGAGVLLPEGHVEGFVGALRLVLEDDEQRTAIVAAAHRVAERYRADAVVEGLEATYRAVLARKRR